MSVPTFVCCGKALGGGLPIAAVVGRSELMAAWGHDGEALHTATFVANPLAIAAALATLEVLESDDLVGRARRLGTQLSRRLEDELGGRSEITAVRGRGMLWGIEVEDQSLAHAWVARATGSGVLVLAGGPAGGSSRSCRHS